MKRLHIIFTLLLLQLVLPCLFDIKWEIFKTIQFLIPQRPIHIMLAILQNILYVYLMYNFVYQYQMCENYIKIRIGQKGFRKKIIFKHMTAVLIIFIINPISQFICYHETEIWLNLINVLILSTISIVVSCLDLKSDFILLVYLCAILVSKYFLTILLGWS